MIDISTAPFDIIRKLSFSPYKFYLTGSRHMGFPRRDSDWDFFTEYTADIQEYLKKSDFTRVSMDPAWMDTNTQGIYRHHAGVEIALQFDVVLKMKAQKQVENNQIEDLIKRTEKRNRCLIWNNIYAELQCP